MHFIYRTKKQPLPIVNDPKLSPYYHQVHYSPTNTFFSRKKSIDVILEKHKLHSNNTINDQILIYNQPARKTSYRPSKTRKAESGYLKNPTKIELSETKIDHKLLTRNRSTQLTEKVQNLWGQRKKGESEYSPYLISQYKKSRSNSKFKAADQVQQMMGRDWICQKFIQSEVYAVQQSNDFI